MKNFLKRSSGTPLPKGALEELLGSIKTLTKYGAYNRSMGPYEIVIPAELFRNVKKQIEDLDGMSWRTAHIFKDPAYESSNALVFKAYGCMITLRKAPIKRVMR